MNRRTIVIALGLVALVAALGYLDSRALIQEAQALDGGVPGSGLGTGQVRMGSEHFSLNWNVLAHGGNTMRSSHFRLSSTLGQAVIGRSDSAHFGHRAGYWQNFPYRVYLPVVLRD
jgi:hypothetical protein